MSADKSTATKAVEKLQRFLLPRAGEPYDVRMLYLIEAEHNTARATWEDRGSVSLAAGNELSF